jgi:ribosomal protein S18 acetylase RimI-like enzyme
MPPLVIRAAVAADAAALATLHVESWRVGYRGVVPDDALARLSVARRERQWQEWISQGTWIRLAERGHRLVGLCALQVSPDGATGEIGALYVDPPAFRTGIGSTLLARALDHLRAGGAEAATLWVFAANERARSFYARHGFEPDGATGEQIAGAPEIRLRLALRGL